MRLSFTSTDSLTPERTTKLEFTVSWRDPCYDAQLKPALFNQDSYEYEVYDTLSVSFTSMEDLDNGYKCGGYSNIFKYVAGPVADDSFSYGADLLS